MRTTISILVLVLLCQFLLGQKTEVIIGEPNRWDYPKDITETYDLGLLVSAGYENEFGWAIKTDINLEQLWDFNFEFPSVSVYTSSMELDTLGNIYICGAVNGWPFVTKLDSCGNKIWCKVLQYEDEYNYGSSRDIVLTKNDEIVLLTYLDSDDEIALLFLIGLSLNGDVLWKKPYASKNDYPWIHEPSAKSLTEINNEYYISGYCFWPYPDDTTHVFLRPLFIGIDSLFNEKWILPFYALDSIYGTAYETVPLNDSVFMGAGIRRAYDSSNEDMALLMFFNNDGEELGYAHIDNDQLGPDIKGSVIRDIVAINDTQFMTSSQFGPEFGGNPGGEFVIDTTGNISNFQSRPNTIAASPKLIKTYDNNYVIATSIEETKGDWDIYLYKIDENLQDVPFDPTPHNYDSLCPGGIQSGTTDLSDCLVWTNIGNAPSPQEYYASIKQIPIRAYPNPVSEGIITFEFKNTEHHNNIELKCFDLYGKEILSEKVYRYQTEAIVDIAELQQGIYVAVVYSNGWPVGECKFVVQ